MTEPANAAGGLSVEMPEIAYEEHPSLCKRDQLVGVTVLTAPGVECWVDPSVGPDPNDVRSHHPPGGLEPAAGDLFAQRSECDAA